MNCVSSSPTIKFYYRKRKALSVEAAKKETEYRLAVANKFKDILQDDILNLDLVSMVKKQCERLTEDGLEIVSTILPSSEARCPLCIEESDIFIKWINDSLYTKFPNNNKTLVINNNTSTDWDITT